MILSVLIIGYLDFSGNSFSGISENPGSQAKFYESYLFL